jgi:hemerythrin-like domain-containing protein
MPRFLDRLYHEHRMIGAVLHGMRYLIDAHRTRGMAVDAKVFRAMLYYLDVFPEREHHPKEEQHLFAILRRRSSEAEAALDRLAQDHEAGEHAIRSLEQALMRYEEGGEREFAAFAREADEFIDQYWDHMRREENEVMPLAERVLEPGDWRDIEIQFALNRDPLSGVDAEDYHKLFARIVNIAPPPIGVGPG